MKLAKSSDVAIVCVGNHPNGGYDMPWEKVVLPSYGREAVDRQSITLENEALDQTDLSRANPRTIVVLVSSFPYAINWTQEACSRPSSTSRHASEEQGNALADVLFGDYNPAGRLGRDLAEITRPIAADDGLQHPRRPDLHVFQIPAALSLRLRLELHDVWIFKFEHQFACV